MSAQGIRAGQAYVELTADGSSLNAGLAKAQARLKKFGADVRQAGTSVGLAGAALIAPFAASVAKFISTARDGKLAGGDLAKAVDLSTAINQTKNSILGLEVAVGSDLAPTLTTMAKALTGVIDSTKQWIRENPGAATAVGLVAASVAGLGTALFGLGVAIQIASFAFGGLAIAGSAAMGALLSPITLTSAAVAGLGYLLTTHTETGAAGLRMLSDGFETLRSDATLAWGGIGDALASGDLGLAAQIGLKLVEVEFKRSFNFLQEFTYAFLVGIMKGFITLGANIAKIMVGIEATIAEAMEKAKIAAEVRQVEQDSAIAYLLSAAGEKTGILPQGTTGQTLAATDANINAAKAAAEIKRAGVDGSAARAVADIVAQAAEMKQTLTDGLSEVITENDGSIQALRAQLEALRGKAATAREAMERENKRRGDEYRAQLAPAASSKADVFGTFSTAASFGIGLGATAQDRTAKATEQAAKELKEINGKFDRLTGATFSP